MFIFLGMKSIWALSIVLAFVAGSVLTGTISFADDDDSESEVVEALEEVSEQLDELNEALDEAIFRLWEQWEQNVTRIFAPWKQLIKL